MKSGAEEMADVIKNEARALARSHDAWRERAEKVEARARQACQTLVAAFGSVGPEDVEHAAERAAKAHAEALARVADLEAAVCILDTTYKRDEPTASVCKAQGGICKRCGKDANYLFNAAGVADLPSADLCGGCHAQRALAGEPGPCIHGLAGHVDGGVPCPRASDASPIDRAYLDGYEAGRDGEYAPSESLRKWHKDHGPRKCSEQPAEQRPNDASFAGTIEKIIDAVEMTRPTADGGIDALEFRSRVGSALREFGSAQRADKPLPDADATGRDHDLVSELLERWRVDSASFMVRGQLARLLAQVRAEERARTETAGPDVEVRDLYGGGNGPWRLFINGVGVADWPTIKSCEPKEYTEEVARCIRRALQTGSEGRKEP